MGTSQTSPRAPGFSTKLWNKRSIRPAVWREGACQEFGSSGKVTEPHAQGRGPRREGSHRGEDVPGARPRCPSGQPGLLPGKAGGRRTTPSPRVGAEEAARQVGSETRERTGLGERQLPGFGLSGSSATVPTRMGVLAVPKLGPPAQDLIGAVLPTAT